ncbi:MBL fold metallo-hydrolase [Phytoactinopolyspora alkaliphila]|uniref:MBL fold metallo-hydrolase n=1 Tax=Phytoactinopolyspora alkaliphila TaxID=1783498 RepID=A0A6N9YJ25_9ACTN|nr:MBL fold metallo-hydrolase [Phytoactinopolyspora alkaliphila]NED94869.1 MBL fold metallo-hydrolase [Phytoactinopolyspora alkaliphila]
MKLTKFEHSCVLVEDGAARVLIDPGNFSHGFEALTDLTAVLVTHQHPDHVDLERLPALIERNPDASVYADPGTAELLAENHITCTTVRSGDRVDVGTRVDVYGEQHAVIHPDIPVIANVGYLVGGRFFHPGDSFTAPDTDVEILGLPTAAPWQKISEAIEFLRGVAPATAIPIHQALLAKPEMYYGHFQRLGPQGMDLRVIAAGESVTL